MNEALGLIKVNGLGDVVWDHGIVLPELGYAIYLNGELNGNVFAPQVTGQRDDRGGSPALSEQDDVSVISFLRGENTIMIGVQQSQDSLASLLPAAIFEYADVGSRRRAGANLLRKFDWAVMRIVILHETADEADKNVFRG